MTLVFINFLLLRQFGNFFYETSPYLSNFILTSLAIWIFCFKDH